MGVVVIRDELIYLPALALVLAALVALLRLLSGQTGADLSQAAEPVVRLSTAPSRSPEEAGVSTAADESET
jgi:hypothetical protein